MYNCGICGAVSGPGVPLRKHTIHRTVRVEGHGTVYGATRQEIHQEVPVCSCCSQLLTFTPLAILMKQRGQVRQSVSVIKPQGQTENIMPVPEAKQEPVKAESLPRIRFGQYQIARKK